MSLKNAANQAKHAAADDALLPDKLQAGAAAALGLAAFLFYKYILEYYYGGDPHWYQIYYDSLMSQDLLGALTSQSKFLGSSEVIYPVIAWLGSRAGIDRNTLMAAFDGVFYFFIASYLIREKCSPLFVALTLTNFYLVVLCTSAERLKFSYLFLVFALFASGRLRFAWVALSPLAHFQNIITISSLIIYNFLGNLSLKVKIVMAVISSLGAGAIVFLFSDALSSKFASYSGRGDVFDAIPAGMVLIVSLFVFKNKSLSFFSLLPLVMLSAILGGERVNMIVFTIFYYIVLSEKKTRNPVVLVMMGYFSFKTIGYIQNVFSFGDGFAAG